MATKDHHGPGSGHEQEPKAESNADELIYDAIKKFSHYIEGRGNSLGDEIAKALIKVRQRMVSSLLELQDDKLGGKEFDQATRRQRTAMLKAQKAETDRVLAEVFRDIGVMTEAAAADAMTASYTHIGKTVAGAIGVEVGAGHLSKAAIESWFKSATIEGRVITEWLSKTETFVAESVVKASRMAMLQGFSVDKAARLIRSEGIERTVPRLRALARTSMHSAASYAREEMFAELEKKEVIAGYRHSALLDGRTCIICGNLDGQTYPAGKLREPLPLHIGCRCDYIAYTEDQSGKAGERAAVKEEARTVQHRDGSTSTKYAAAQVDFYTGTYNDWMKKQLKQDPEFVRRVLGKTRFEAFRDGRITLEKMVVNGRIRTLNELNL